MWEQKKCRYFGSSIVKASGSGGNIYSRVFKKNSSAISVKVVVLTTPVEVRIICNSSGRSGDGGGESGDSGSGGLQRCR